MQSKAIPMSPSNSFGKGKYNKTTLGYLGKISPGHQDKYRESLLGPGITLILRI